MPVNTNFWCFWWDIPPIINYSSVDITIDFQGFNETGLRPRSYKDLA